MQNELSSAATQGAPRGEAATMSQRRVLQGGSLTALGLVLSQAISFVTFVILARLAPPATFGAYAAASVLLQTGNLFAGGGMQAAVVQRPAQLQETASTAFAANVLGGVCLAGLAAACAPLIGMFFKSGEVGRAAAALAGTILIGAVSIVPAALLQRRVSLLFGLIQPLASVAYGVAAIVAVGSGMGLWGFVLATYIAECARTGIVWSLARWRPSPRLVSWDLWRSISRYSRPVVVSLFLREVGLSGGTAVVGRLFGQGDLGRFRAAQRLVLQSNTAVVYGSAYVLLPAFARLWQQDTARFRHAVLRATRMLSIVVFPLSLGFIPLGRPIATIMLGQRWRETGSIAIMMAGVGVALALDSISSEAFKATDHTKFLPRMHGLTALVPIGLMLVFSPFGPAGAGLALSIGMCVVALYATRALAGIAGASLRELGREAGPALASAIVMAAAVWLLDRYVVHADRSTGAAGLARLVVDLGAAAIAYLGCLSVISRQSVRELGDIAKLAAGRRRA